MADENARTFRAGPLRIRVSAGQPQPRRSPITTDQIVDVAMAQMKDHGYPSVSMRSIARALDTGPASLYAHVANRDHLDQLVVNRIAESLTIPDPDPERWESQLKGLLLQQMELFREHPGAARASMAIIPTEYGTLRTAEGLLALLRCGGIADQPAAWFCDVVSLYVAGAAFEESIWDERSKDGKEGERAVAEEAMVNQIRQYFRDLPADEFPLVTALADVLTGGGGEARFEFGIDILIAGLKAYSARA